MGILDAVAQVGKTAWDMFAQHKTWDREDTAIQRRVEDLRKAGLSPTLAAGSAAQTSGPIDISTPQPEQAMLESKQMARAIARQDADISRVEAEKNLTEMQINREAISQAPLNWLQRNHVMVNDGGVERPWQEALGLDWLREKRSLSEAAQMAPAETAARIEESQARKELAVQQYIESAHDYGIRKSYGVLKSDSNAGLLGKALQGARFIQSPVGDAIRGKLGDLNDKIVEYDRRLQGRRNEQRKR